MKHFFKLIVTGLLLNVSLGSLWAQDRPCSKTCNNSVTHDYTSCIDDLIDMGSGLKEIGMGIIGGDVRVSLKEEMELGEESLRESKKKYRFITSGAKLDNLRSIMQRLIQKIQKPQGYTFSLYLLDSDVINAWTCGGKIYVTTGIYDFCNNNDEIACILGHEISHNLLGHINGKLREYKAASQFGIFGQVAASLGSFLTTAFGQKDEAHSDLLGVDFARAAGFNGCAAISLWKRMADKQGEFDQLSNFLSSHPHPEKRADCITEHIKSTYSIQCGN